jgi:hypothetical protein
MTRSIWMLALCLFAFAPPARAEGPAFRDPHIRATEPDLLDDLARGASVSPTLRRLIDRLESSNVVVYLMFDGAAAPESAGHLSLLASVPDRRYLRIVIDRRLTGCRRLAILGHELQHAVEIADAASVTDQRSMASLYRTIGFRSPNGRDDCFDSRSAIQTGERVQRELLAGPGTFAGR